MALQPLHFFSGLRVSDVIYAGVLMQKDDIANPNLKSASVLELHALSAFLNDRNVSDWTPQGLERQPLQTPLSFLAKPAPV
jgi:hypothetical protein